MSTPHRFLPVWIPFLAFALLVLAQWPAGFLLYNVSMSLGILLNEWLVVAGLPLLIMKIWRIPFFELFPFRKIEGRTLFWTIVMTSALIVLIDYLIFLSERLFAPSPEVKFLLEKVMTAESGADWAWRWFLICLTPAFCEEFFFRGFFQTAVGERWGKKPALFLSAFLFALVHGIPAYWHLYLILGIYLAWLMLIGRNLWLAILAHLLNNSWTFIAHTFDITLPLKGIWHFYDPLVMLSAVAIFAFSSQKVPGTFGAPSPKEPVTF